MMNKVVFGIDVGGTTIKCGFFSDDGELIEKEELPTRKENSGENILPDIAEYIKMTLAMHKKKFTDIAGIGIGVPGAVRDDGTVNKCVNLGWDVVNVPKKLSVEMSVMAQFFFYSALTLVPVSLPCLPMN